MGISKEEQREMHRKAGNVSFSPQKDIKVIEYKKNKIVKSPRKKQKKVNMNVYKEELTNCNNNNIKVLKVKEHKVIIKPQFIKRAVKLLPLDKNDKRISFYDAIRFGKYKGRTGRQVLKTNKKYLKRLQADQNIIFCPIMIARLKN